VHTRVVVGPGVLARAEAALARELGTTRRCIVISDNRVARLHAQAFVAALAARGARASLLTFPAGERSKTRETKARLEDGMLRLGADRESVVVALGGGVTGDLAGFVASTWHRGIPVVQIPTSLLAMLDAAIGGKTAVDLPGGKNAIGTIHQPVALWADVRLLETLPDRAFRAGLAEAVKLGAACDAALFRSLERDAPRLARREERAVASLVARCLAAKGRIVSADPHDAGARRALNFGHTVAHALETACDFAIPHGEAVAVGLVAEAAAARRRTGLSRADAERITALLSILGLPVRAPRGLDRKRLLDAMDRDKKRRGGAVRCALPRRIGSMPRKGDPTVPLDAARDLLPFLVRN